MSCNAEISTSTISHHKHRNQNRHTSPSIQNSKPRTRSGHVSQDPNKRNTSALVGRKEDDGRSKFIGIGGLGCVRLTPVTAPEVIRTAADWEERTKSVRRRSRADKKSVQARVGISADVCCGPGIGFVADAALVDCVDSRRPVGPRTSHQQIQLLDSRSYPGGSFSVHDRFGGWRLDVDSMSYEELLALGDRIGHVGTGLREEKINRYIRKIKHSVVLESLPLLVLDNKDWSCSICQIVCIAALLCYILLICYYILRDGFEEEDAIGKLECNHMYHMLCIKQWLLRKNACPVCKAAAATIP